MTCSCLYACFQLGKDVRREYILPKYRVVCTIVVLIHDAKKIYSIIDGRFLNKLRNL
jgi:hypothetical protein